MPRNMSFALTTEAIRHRAKTVTRRKGWRFLKVGDAVNACVKCQGLKKGERVEKLATLRIVQVRREPLNNILLERDGVAREGFPCLTPGEFVEMFRRHMGGGPNQNVTRIEFEYVD